MIGCHLDRLHVDAHFKCKMHAGPDSRFNDNSTLNSTEDVQEVPLSGNIAY